MRWRGLGSSGPLCSRWIGQEDEGVESGQSRNVNENVAEKEAWTKRRVKNIKGTGVDVQAETTEGFLS